MSKLDWALRYASIGWKVFPVVPGWKTPACSHGFHDATIDESKIKAWWSNNPNYNIGIRCGSEGSKILCLDIDKKKDKNGFIWLNSVGDTPITIEQTTPSGGKQYIFVMPEEGFGSTSDDIAVGVDIRADGGYFVAPPSIINARDGYEYSGQYRWTSDQDPFSYQATSVPEWLLSALRKSAIFPEQTEEETDGEFSKILPITAVISKYNIHLKQMSPTHLAGAHPIHGSSNGLNFHVNTQKNQWACWRHRKPDATPVGGGVFKLIALMEGILECQECIPKSLTGDRFKRVLEIIETKFGISKDKFNSESIDSIYSAIKKASSISEPLAKLEELKRISTLMAKMKDQDILPLLSAMKKDCHLSSDELKAMKLIIADNRKHKNMTADCELVDFDKFGNPKDTDRNIMAVIKKDFDDTFKKEMFSNEVRVLCGGEWAHGDKKFPRPIKDDDIDCVKQYIINKYGIQPKWTSVNEMIRSHAIRHSYDALEDYLTNLKWDGVQRLDTWMHNAFGVEDTPYHRRIGKLVLVAAVKRAMYPAIKYDHVLVLAGDQSIMKSTAIEVLASDEWFTEMKLDGKDKDIVQKMQGKWIIELSEGISLKKKEADEMKMFIVQKKHRERFAYARNMETYSRRSIFIMTINPSAIGYLPDKTGNRRYLIVRMTDDVNIKWLKENRDQLFAEAMADCNKDYPIFLHKTNDADIIAALENEHGDAEIKDDWEDCIVSWLTTGKIMVREKEYGKTVINFIDLPIPEHSNCMAIFVNVFNGNPTDYDPMKQGRRIGGILTRLGLRSRSYRTGDSIKKGFPLKLLSEKLKEIDFKSVVKNAESISNNCNIDSEKTIEWEE